MVLRNFSRTPVWLKCSSKLLPACPWATPHGGQVFASGCNFRARNLSFGGPVVIWVLNGHIIFRSARCPVRINSRRIRIPRQRLALSQIALIMFLWGVLALLSMAAAAKSPSRQREAAARHRRRQGIPVRLPRRGDRAASMRALRFARSAEAAAVGPPPPLPALPAPPQFVPEQLRRFQRFVRACWDYRRSWLCSSLSTAASIAISLVPARPSAPRAVLLSLAVARLGLQEGVEAILQHLFRRDWRSVEQALRGLSSAGGRMQTGTRRSAVFTHGLDGAAQHRAYLQRWASSSVFAWLVSAVRRQQPASALMFGLSHLTGCGPYSAKNFITALVAQGLTVWDAVPIGPGSRCSLFALVEGQRQPVSRVSGIWPWQSAPAHLSQQAALIALATAASGWIGRPLSVADTQETLCHWHQVEIGRFEIPRREG